MLNHHYRIEIALIKTKLRTKLSSCNQQQPTAIRRQNRNRRKNQKEEIKNSPHNKWSLHNHPPREIRNIIPEVPTQNMPALPHNSSPLVRQHRSHNCNRKTPVTNTKTNTKLKINRKLYIGKYLRI
jgi:hypothetical protein